jgi:hypothetical protein
MMSMGDVDKSFPVLGKAIDLDRFYALKAAGDGDFKPHEEQLRGFLDAMRKEKYKQSVPIVKAALGKIKFWRENAPQASNNLALKRMDSFLKNGGEWPLMDMLEVVQSIKKTITDIETAA